MIKTSSIDSLSNFQKNTKEFMGRLETSKEPLVLTVNGKAKIVVQDADAYQEMLDQVERLKFAEAVAVGISEANSGKVRPANMAFEEMKAKYGL